MERQIDTLAAAIRTTLARPVPANKALAAIMTAAGIDGPGLARPQIATLAAWSTDPRFTEAEQAHATAQLAALGLGA
jgi:hypothetical protein